MKLSIGIVGLPNVGKSTLFKLLTKQEVNIANYPFATITPNIGVVPVPDERLLKLAALSKSEKIIPAIVEFFDIAGLTKGASKGEGLGNQFLAHIREVAAIVHVVRCFPGADVAHVERGVDPKRDFEIVMTELALKDLEVVEKRIKKTTGDARTGKKEAKEELRALEEIKNELERMDFKKVSIQKRANFRILPLLTAKPQIVLLNGDGKDVTSEVHEFFKSRDIEYLVADLGKDNAVPELVQKAYAILNLISFFTTGEDETRAWTVRRGVKAPQAARVIHTDFEKKFIRAEVISYDQLLSAGSWSAAKQKGLIRLEGKEYEVRDGDVIVVRHG